MGKPFFTLEDFKISFSLFCCVYGVGTLSMPKNYASAGFVWATLALVFMAFVNVYATVCISKLLLLAPKSVRTFADLGEFCMGKVGRFLILITQMLACILVPIVFLVLGGSISVILFPNSYGQVTWIILMGLSLLPFCLTPTLKEGAFAAAAGSLGTLVADAIAVYLLIDNMAPMSKGISIPKPDVGFSQVASVFGSLSLAYGAGVVIPALQREHSEPTRMIRAIVITLGTISVLFLLVAVTGVAYVGCQIPGNLLFSISGTPTALSFTANRGGVLLACMTMLLHVIIAFAIVINPAFYILEGWILGIHKHSFAEVPEVENGFVSSSTPIEKDANNETTIVEHNDLHDLDAKTYQQPGVYPKVAALRIIIVAACVAIACAWKDNLSDLLDFAGASCMSLCNMILPIGFYLKVNWRKIGILEKIWCVVAILVCLFLAGYESWKNGKVLFNPPAKSSGPAPWDAVKFPYCPAGSSYQRIVYTNVSYHANFTRATTL
ncbi:hypothetical protein AeMF1_008645 [Aphanomyces euteiches]|nr:hypothetical protein AeMF1_008645 [Aphanomyces euteiches]